MELTAMFIYGGYRDVLGTDGQDSSLINETYCGAARWKQRVPELCGG